MSDYKIVMNFFKDYEDLVNNIKEFDKDKYDKEVNLLLNRFTTIRTIIEKCILGIDRKADYLLSNLDGQLRGAYGSLIAQLNVINIKTKKDISMFAENYDNYKTKTYKEIKEKYNKKYEEKGKKIKQYKRIIDLTEEIDSLKKTIEFLDTPGTKAYLIKECKCNDLKTENGMKLIKIINLFFIVNSDIDKANELNDIKKKFVKYDLLDNDEEMRKLLVKSVGLAEETVMKYGKDIKNYVKIIEMARSFVRIDDLINADICNHGSHLFGNIDLFILDEYRDKISDYYFFGIKQFLLNNYKQYKNTKLDVAMNIFAENNIKQYKNRQLNLIILNLKDNIQKKLEEIMNTKYDEITKQEAEMRKNKKSFVYKEAKLEKGQELFDASKLGQTRIPVGISDPKIVEEQQRKIRNKEVFCEEPEPDYYFISKFKEFFKLDLDLNIACSSISEYRQALDEIKRVLKLKIDLICKIEELRQFGIIEVEEYKDNVKKKFIECMPRLLEFYHSILSI